jgi:hypothetical protein
VPPDIATERPRAPQITLGVDASTATIHTRLPGDLTPRVRVRVCVLELSLAEDARQREWPQEVKRHCGMAQRIECLLTDLGELAQPS